LRAIAAAVPALAPRAARLAARLARLRPAPSRPGVLLHGSFRLNHVLVHRGALAFVDLDGASAGPPAYDVANFLSSLHYLVAEGRLGAAERHAVARHFLLGYRSAAPHAAAPRELSWFLAALLVEKQAMKYVTRPRVAWERKLRAMLSLAERSLARRDRLPREERRRPDRPRLPVYSS
jgi:aminoglycoside phosphotransferase (APT) family kinase protein